MNRQALAELLQNLGEVLLLPGKTLAWEREAWTGAPVLQEAFLALGQAPQQDLETEYAGLFLHGYRHPTIHLEESVMRSGELRNREVMASLHVIYRTAGLDVEAPFQMDHLGVMLALLGHLLLQTSDMDEPEERDLALAAQSLLQDHILPLQGHVLSRMEQVEAHPYYLGVMAVLGLCLQTVQAALSSHLSTHSALAGGVPPSHP